MKMYLLDLKNIIRWNCFGILLIICIQNGYSQNKTSIYLDCQNMFCETSYLKQELSYLDYMQNRQEADVFILSTSQRTSVDGQEVQLVFIGQKEFEGMSDTLIYFTDPDASRSIRREAMVNNVKRGLLPYLLKTSLRNAIDFTVDSEQVNNEAADSIVADPWDHWTFRIGGNGYLNGEESYSSFDLTGRFTASHITDQHKFFFQSRYNYSESQFTLTDGEKFTSLTRNYSVYSQYVKSLGSHWSTGFEGEAGSSTFGNTDIYAFIKPAVEYNYYPYEEVQTRRFSIKYSIGPEFYNYTDTTIYDKLSETIFRHGIEIDFNQNQKWGNVSLDLGVSQFLHNLRYFNANLNPNLDVQIVKGLSVDFGCYISFVSDRLNIAKSDITDEDILLQIKQLDTNFSYFGYFGINYRFGSKFNNIVNRRF